MPKYHPEGEEPVGVALPPEADDPVPPAKQGALYRGGYFAKNLRAEEVAPFRALYAIFKEKYPDLDGEADDALLCEAIKKLLMMQRESPPPTKETSGRNSYDYEVARTKLLLSIFDALGINRKQRKERETAADIEKALSKFFTQDGRTRDKTAGRTLAKGAAPVVVDEVQAERAAREIDDPRFRSEP